MNGMPNLPLYLRILLSLILAACIVPASPSQSVAKALYSGDDLLHDRMGFGEHPDFKWESNVAGWLSYLDGYVAGLPEIDFRSAIISGIRFDETLDTTMVITRFDRNGMSKFYIGYTAVPPFESNYSLDKVAFGAFIDSTGALSPSWDAGNEARWSASLPEGIYDMRITIDRTTSGITFDFEEADSFNAPLSDFDSPAVSVTETVDLTDILHIQMNFYNQYSIVYDTWSVPGTPSLLWIQGPQPMVVAEGDTIVFDISAEYDGQKELQWSFDDPRFAFEDSLYSWVPRDGDGGLYESWLAVTDGRLKDSILVSYAVTQVYDSSLTHDKMSCLGDSPYQWISLGKTVWYTFFDGFLLTTEDWTWEAAAVSTREESLDHLRCWVFRVAAGAGEEYCLGLTNTPPRLHNGRHGNVSLGVLIEEDGKVSPAWYSPGSQFAGTVLEEGLYDIRITWDPAIGEARFEAAAVPTWADSLSDFSGAVWTTWSEAVLDPPAWAQASVIRKTSAVYDVWSYVPADGPDIVEGFGAEARPTGIELTWRVPGEGWIGQFILMHCTGGLERCGEMMRFPVTEGLSVYGYHDRDVLPGSVHRYMVYLDRGQGMEFLFDTGDIEVPVAPAELFQNHPNPFNPATTVRWYLPSASHVKLTIYDVSGRKVRLLADGPRGAGEGSAEWDGRLDGGGAAASGVYFYRIEAGSFSDSKKMILLR